MDGLQSVFSFVTVIKNMNCLYIQVILDLNRILFIVELSNPTLPEERLSHQVRSGRTVAGSDYLYNLVPIGHLLLC